MNIIWIYEKYKKLFSSQSKLILSVQDKFFDIDDFSSLAAFWWMDMRCV